MRDARARLDGQQSTWRRFEARLAGHSQGLLVPVPKNRQGIVK